MMEKHTSSGLSHEPDSGGGRIDPLKTCRLQCAEVGTLALQASMLRYTDVDIA